MNLGRREKVPFPEEYKGFRLVRTHGRVYAVPPSKDAVRILTSPGMMFRHPAVMSAVTLDEMRRRIDGFDDGTLRPQVLKRLDGYDVVRYRGQLLAVPHAAADLDLDLPEDRRRCGVLAGATVAELEAAVRNLPAAVPVEFAGWLPIYAVSGNCGAHPQFSHTGRPPEGYRFACSAPPAQDMPPPRTRRDRVGDSIRGFVGRLGRAVGTAKLGFAFFRPCRGVSVRARLRVFGAFVRLVASLLWSGCKLSAVLRFLQTRHLQSQLLLGEPRELVFLTSMPYTFGQNPWVIEIEDPTTLFYPLIQNGHTCAIELRDSPYFPVVKAVLEADHCKAVVTHMRSTARMVAALFDSDVIRRKIVHAPLGVKPPARWQRHDPEPDDAPIHLLFINSWCQVPSNFYLRGGLDVLEAFAILHERYPQLRLTMRTNLPPLDDHYHRIMEAGWVRVIDRFLTAEEMAELHATSHVFLLPAARVHIVSLLQAMSHGLAVVASDGWGIEEYLEDGQNGLVVKGRYGKSSWADEEAGQLRENYETMYTADPDMVAGIVEAVSRLVEDARLRARLGRQARADVETRFTPEAWNRGLKAAFDLAGGRVEVAATTPDVGPRVADAEEVKV